MRLASLTALALVVLGGQLSAQGELSPEVERRIAVLEAEAARARALEARVHDLEAQLAVTGELAESELLETTISRLVDEAKDPVLATSRKAFALVIGGQLRLRTEYRDVSLYGAENPRATDEDFTIQRTRINFAARIAADVSVFAEIQDSRTWGEERNVLGDLEGVDLHQGYADFEDLFGTGFTLRVGRFELSLWNQRLLSPLDWHPVARSWDGALVFGDIGDVSIIGGYQILDEDPVIDSDRDEDFYWGAATWRPSENHEIGVAFFWRHDDSKDSDISFGTPTVHAQGSFGAFDYSIDLVANFGDRGDLDVEAYGTAVQFGFTFDCPWSPRIAVEWTWASGDDDPTDGDFGTFDPLFPFQHYYQGYLDIFAWKNGHDVALHLEARPSEKLWFEIVGHAFFLDQTSDAWFGAAGTPIRSDPSADDEYLGFEIDVSFKYTLRPNVLFWVGYSHFFAGDFVDETGDDPNTNWFFVQLTANF